jgi:DNA-binding NtrC family response regulator
VLVQHLHASSARANGPFVAENCSAIPESLAESLLFGHVRGSFTGADRDRIGLFAQADGGTLFLDEIGEMPLAMQARLLRVLEERRVRPVGGTKALAVDVRVVCATNRDLAALVRDGKFRADLYYRLAGVMLRIPALRERTGDVALLAAHFLDEQNSAHGTRKSFASGLLARMKTHPWPGNVRELRNCVAALYHLSGGDVIDGELPSVDLAQHTGGADARLVTRVAPLAEIEKEAIRLALNATGGDRREAARRLGISRSTLYVRIRDLGL